MAFRAESRRAPLAFQQLSCPMKERHGGPGRSLRIRDASLFAHPSRRASEKGDGMMTVSSDDPVRMPTFRKRARLGTTVPQGFSIFRLRQGAEILVEVAENGTVVEFSLLLRLPPEEFFKVGMGAEGEEGPCIQAAETSPMVRYIFSTCAGASRPFAIRRVADDAPVFPARAEFLYGLPLERNHSARPARFAFCAALFRIEPSASDASIRKGASLIADLASSLASSQTLFGMWGHSSQTNDRFRPGATFFPMRPASMAIVPEPQKDRQIPGRAPPAELYQCRRQCLPQGGFALVEPVSPLVEPGAGRIDVRVAMSERSATSIL